MNFWKNANNGYIKAVELINDCWSYLFSGEWYCSIGDVLLALALFAMLIPITLFAYLCVAPFVAFLEGTREEGE